MNPQVKKELLLINCALGMLCVYEQQSPNETTEKLKRLISDLKRISNLYKDIWQDLLIESFDKFDQILGEKELDINTVAFANSLLVFHRTIKKHFSPKQKAVNDFWVEYKKEHMDQLREFSNSRRLAKEFFERL